LKELFELVEKPDAQHQKQVKTTAVLALSTLLYQACVNTRIRNTRYPVALYGQFCDAQVVANDFLPYYKRQLQRFLKDESDNHWQAVYLVALGNIGHPQVIPIVQEILDDSNDPYVKTKAIFALKHLIVSREVQNYRDEKYNKVDRNTDDIVDDKIVEKKVLPILMSVAFDKSEHHSVRLAAIQMLLYTTYADVAVWQQLAYSTWFETSQEVHSFIYSSLRSLADLKRPFTHIHWRMQRLARTVAPLAKPFHKGFGKSRNVFSAQFVDELSTGVFHHLSYFGSRDSLIPNNVYYRNYLQFGSGGMGVHPIEANIHGRSISKIVDAVMDRLTRTTADEKEGHPQLQEK
jgi:hypothetical protein